jgi:hypothetical protein
LNKTSFFSFKMDEWIQALKNTSIKEFYQSNVT